MLTLTDVQRDQADRRDPDGAITSLREARELYRRRIDKEYADKLVEAVYARACELHDHRAAHFALDLARDNGFISRLVAPIVTWPRANT